MIMTPNYFNSYITSKHYFFRLFQKYIPIITWCIAVFSNASLPPVPLRLKPDMTSLVIILCMERFVASFILDPPTLESCSICKYITRQICLDTTSLVDGLGGVDDSLFLHFHAASILVISLYPPLFLQYRCIWGVYLIIKNLQRNCTHPYLQTKPQANIETMFNSCTGYQGEIYSQIYLRQIINNQKIGTFLRKWISSYAVEALFSQIYDLPVVVFLLHLSVCLPDRRTFQWSSAGRSGQGCQLVRQSSQIPLGCSLYLLEGIGPCVGTLNKEYVTIVTSLQ